MADELSSALASLRIDRGAPPAHVSSAPKVGRIAAVAGGILAVCALGWVAYAQAESRLFAQEIQTTEIVMLSPSQAEVQVTATGYVIPQRTSKVGSTVAGRVAKVLVKEGDFVNEGDVIAQLADDDQRSLVAATNARAAAARARIATARANLADLKQQIDREQKLVGSGAVAKAGLDDLRAREVILQSQVQTASAEALAARADVGTMGVGLKERSIRAPISGRIVSKPVTVGEYVGGIASSGVIAEIVDFESLLVEADVPEARLYLTKLDSPCEIVLDAFPNKRLRGVVSELGQRVTRAKATVVVKVKFIDPVDFVLPEMSARVSFLSKPISDEALAEAPKRVVASDAIADRGGQKVVFAVEDGTLRAVPVTLGTPLGGSIELLDGPPPGAKVVSKPTKKTDDGQRVKLASK